jgi:glycosyltransferase involved in cell wall biosynthesis
MPAIWYIQFCTARWGAEIIRICYLANASSIHTRRLASFFARKHEVHIISFEEGKIDGGIVHRIRMPFISRNKTFPLKLLYLGRIRRLVEEIDPDVIHAVYVTNYGFFASKCDIHPFVLTAIGSDVLSLDTELRIVQWVKRRLACSALRKADVITTNGLNTAQRMQQLGVKSQDIKTFQFGIDVDKFRHSKRGLLLKKELGLSGPIVISSRNFYPIYDVETLVRAIPFVLRRFPTALFLIAGRGSEEGKLRALAGSLNITEKVRFVGHIPNDGLPNYLSAADVYVSTSLSDSSVSVSTAEAMACELPVIVTDVADNRKWVDDGVNGFVVPSKDPKSLAEKIVFLLEHEDVRKRFGKINRLIIEDRDNYVKEMSKLEEIYKKAVERYDMPQKER